MKLGLWLLIVSIVNFIATVVAVLLLGSNVPIHLNSSFEVVKMGSPFILLIISLIPIICAIALLVELKIRGKHIKNKKLLTMILYSVSGLIIYINWIMVGVSSSDLLVGDRLSLPIDLFVYVPIGIFMGIIGVLFLDKKYKVKVLGLKEPIYQENKNKWEKIHNLTGWTFLICGLLIVVGALVSYFFNLFWIGICITIIAFSLFAVVPITYARIAYRAKNMETDNRVKEMKKSGITDSELVSNDSGSGTVEDKHSETLTTNQKDGKGDNN